MRKFTLFFVAMLCAVGVRAAVTITADGSNGVIVKADNAGELNSFTPNAEQQTLLTNSTAITLTGYFDGNDMQKLSSYGKNAKTSLDFSEAHFTVNPATDWGPATSTQTYKYWDNVKDIKMSKYETVTPKKFDLFENGCKKIENIEINGNIDIAGGVGFFNDQTSIKSIKFGPNVGTIGSDAFNGCSNLTALDLGGVQDIGFQAFAGCSMTELTIPGTVKHIGENAFINCDDITEIVFQEHLDENGKSDVEMVIEPLAFRQADKIWNIYIKTEGNLTCKNNAFDFATTFGHGSTEAKTATLHYPNSKVEAYCNMNHVLTYQTAQNAKDFHEWLLAHYQQATTPHKNGWYEFVNSGPSSQEDQEPDAKVLRTYSFYYPVTIENGKPVTVAKLVPQGVKAYIVNGIKKNTDGNYELTLKSIFAIPANTGVLLYGTPNSMTENNVPSLVMNTVAFEGYPIRRDYWNIMASDETKNMLMPTCIEFDNYGEVKKVDGHEVEVKLASRGIVVGPYDKGTDGKVKYRNFFMTKFSKTDLAKQYTANEYVGFFRAKKSWIRSGKAFLRLADKEYNSPKGAEAIILKDGDYKKEYDKNGNPIDPSPLWSKLTWEDISDWGKRSLPAGAKAVFLGEPELEEDEEGTVTLVIPAAEAVQDGVYYTLQGVKVEHPTKGIYIRNGKKVVVK